MSIANELQTLTTNVQGVLDGKACIAQAITSKGVPTADDASFDTLAVNVGLIEGGGGGSGIRRVQFTVTLEEESTYLPLSQLTEIPDALIVSSYDSTLREASSGYCTPDSTNPSYGHIVSLSAIMPPIPYLCNSSGPRIEYSAGSAYVFNDKTAIRYSTAVIQSYNRCIGGSIDGWRHANQLTLAQYQNAFPENVATQGYALDSDGKLVIRTNPIQTKYNFGANMQYIVTALYDILPSDTLGIISGLNRTVNSTNVKETV